MSLASYQLLYPAESVVLIGDQAADLTCKRRDQALLVRWC